MKLYTTIVIAFLALIAVLQLVRFILSWEVILNGAVVPVWASGIAFVIVGGLAVMLWLETRR